MFKPATALAAASLVALTACMGNNPQASSSYDKTRNGAIIGGTAGLLSQIIAGNSTNSKIKATIAGAAVGAGVGYVLDRQEADLRNRIGDSGAVITNAGDRLIVTLPEGITFETDSTYVRPNLRGDIIELAESLNTYPETTVDVIGHTDSDGDEGYNQNLSSRRAEAVSDILLNNSVDYDRLRSYGRGELEPVASNDTESGRAQNRRVEVVIRPTS